MWRWQSVPTCAPSALVGFNLPRSCLEQRARAETTHGLERSDVARNQEASSRFLGGTSTITVLATDLMSLPWVDRIRLVSEHLFPSIVYMRARYPSWSGALLPLAYVHRIAAAHRNGSSVRARGRMARSPDAHLPLVALWEDDMAAARLDASIHIPDDVIFRDLDGEAVVLQLDTGLYFGLDAVGTRIWQLMEQHKALRPVFIALVDEDDAPADRIEHDLLALVDRLSGKGLVAIG